MVSTAWANRCATAAHSTPRVRRMITRAHGPALIFGAYPTACYLGLPGGGVVALLTRDATGLPLGMLLPQTSRTLDLSQSSSAWIGGGVLTVGGVSSRPLPVRPDGRRDLTGRPDGRPDPATVAEVRSALAGLDTGLTEVATGGRPVTAATVPELIGRGPGLTPAGDDLVCGYLTGCRLFDLDAPALTAATLRLLDQGATTSLSAALLRHACLGESLPELTNLARAMCARRRAAAHPGLLRAALRAVTGIGHSSGPALAAGLCSAAEAAVHCATDNELEGALR